MTDINLHFTGDFHAIGAAHNLLAALIDNHIHWGNELRFDFRRVAWRRVVDMNDRALREIVFRANTGELHSDEARVALEALVRHEGDAMEDGEEFVRSVAEGFCWGLPRYRRSLRRLAASVLESDRWL